MVLKSSIAHDMRNIARDDERKYCMVILRGSIAHDIIIGVLYMMVKGNIEK